MVLTERSSNAEEDPVSFPEDVPAIDRNVLTSRLGPTGFQALLHM
jgi:hypothetical protein